MVNNNNERFSVLEAKRLEECFKRYAPRIDHDECMVAKSSVRIEREYHLYMRRFFLKNRKKVSNSQLFLNGMM
jgi:hypothetical protein